MPWAYIKILICIFMNNNENDENQDLQRENLLVLILKCLGWAIFRTYPARLEQMLMGVSLVRGSL